MPYFLCVKFRQEKLGFGGPPFQKPRLDNHKILLNVCRHPSDFFQVGSSPLSFMTSPEGGIF